MTGWSGSPEDRHGSMGREHLGGSRLHWHQVAAPKRGSTRDVKTASDPLSGCCGHLEDSLLPWNWKARIRGYWRDGERARTRVQETHPQVVAERGEK